MPQEDREMTSGQDADQVMGEVSPGGTEGGRRPTGVPPGEAGVRPLAQGQRWTAHRKREVVLRILRGEPLELLSRELGGRALPAGKVARRCPGGHGGGS